MKENNLTPPAGKVEANALQAIMKIAAASVHMNLAINKGLEAAELAREVFDPVHRKEIKLLADMVTRIRHDSRLLEKKFTDKEHIKDFLYDVFGFMTEIIDYAMLLEPEELEALRDELKAKTAKQEIRL